jgi:hypothetical protein
VHKQQATLSSAISSRLCLMKGMEIPPMTESGLLNRKLLLLKLLRELLLCL